MALGGDGRLISCVNIPSCLVQEDRGGYLMWQKGLWVDARFTLRDNNLKNINWEIMPLICCLLPDWS